MTEVLRRRIALVGPAAPFRGGIAQFTDTIASGLRDRRNHVYVATFQRQYPAFLFPGKTQYDPEKKALATADRLIDSVNPVTWVKTAKMILQRDVTAAVFQYWMPYFAPAYATIAARLKNHGVRVLAVVHNVVPHEKHVGDDRLGRYFLEKCDGYLTLSDSVAEDLEELGMTAPIETVAHPVYQHFGEAVPRDEARRRLGVAGDAELLLFFGFVRPYKGLQTLLKAMPGIIAKRPKVRLIVAGEFYEDEASYRSMISDLDLGAFVDVRADYVPEGEVGTYFSAANLVVQPYASATQSGVVQTAYNFDRPVVVTDVGGLAEVVPNDRSGYVVRPNDPAALGQAVVRYFAEENEERFVDGVRREKERYTWTRLLDVLERMAGESVPAP
jgi:glycosyltransferase involved in cell wall biosynthesis